MIDIALCNGIGCNMRELCGRYEKITIKNYSKKDKNFVSYFMTTPFTLSKEGLWECEYFLGQKVKQLK